MKSTYHDRAPLFYKINECATILAGDSAAILQRSIAEKLLLVENERNSMEKDQAFVESIVKEIVNHPEDVRTERTIDERGVLITLHINQEDMGYVIGRSGQTARSIRTLLKIVGAKENARVNLKIHEPEGSRRPPREERAPEAAVAPAPVVEEEETDTSVVDNLSL